MVWKVVEKIARAALLVDRRALELIGRTNSRRAERAELVEDRLRTKPWALDLKYLQDDHRAYDLSVEWADVLQRGLQSLAPGIIEIQQQEDSRHLLLQAVDVMNRVRSELQRGLRPVALRDPAHDLPTSGRE